MIGERRCFIFLYLPIPVVAFVRLFFVGCSTGNARSSCSGCEERVCSYSEAFPRSSRVSLGSSQQVERIAPVRFIFFFSALVVSWTR